MVLRHLRCHLTTERLLSRILDHQPLCVDITCLRPTPFASPVSMGDSKWTNNLVPVMDEAVSALACSISGKLLDKLFAKKCLHEAQYEEILDIHDKSGLDKAPVARKLFLQLKKHLSPSFDNFCSIIKEYDMELFRILNPSVQESKKSSGNNILSILVDEKLMRAYQPHHRCVVAMVDSVIEMTEHIPKELRVSLRGVPGMTLKCPRKNQVGNEIVISDHCDLRIFLPKTDPEHFKEQQEALFGQLSSLLDYTNIEILSGSCSVTVTLRGINFVRFICDLQDARCLLPFIELDKDVEIQFGSGSLCSVKLSCLLKQTLMTSSVIHALIIRTTSTSKGSHLLAKFPSLCHSFDAVASLQSKLRLGVVQTALPGEREVAKIK